MFFEIKTSTGVYTGVTNYIDWIQDKTGIKFKLNMYLRA